MQSYLSKFKNWSLVATFCLLCFFLVDAKFGKFRFSTTSMGDFDQYYMGAVAIVTGNTGEIYPQNAQEHNKHIDENSTPISMDGSIGPFLKSELTNRGWKGFSNFVYPPPLAIIVSPLGIFNYKVAVQIWLIINLICVYLILRRVEIAINASIKSAYYKLLLMSLVVTGIPLLAALQFGNPGIVMSAATILLIKDWNGKGLLSAVSIIILTLTKGLGLVIVPVYLIAKKWGCIKYCCILSIILLTASFVFFDISDYYYYLKDVIPASNFPFWLKGDANQSYCGFLFNILGVKFDNLILYNNIMKCIVYVPIYVLYVISIRKDQSFPSFCILAIITASLVLSPITWYHYPVVILPLLAQLVKETYSRALIGILLVSFVLLWAPIAPLLKKLTFLDEFGFIRTLGYFAIIFSFIILNIPKMRKFVDR